MKIQYNLIGNLLDKMHDHVCLYIYYFILRYHLKGGIIDSKEILCRKIHT